MAIDGKPAITTPGVLVLRPVQDAISAIRQRMQKIEASITALQNTGTRDLETSINALRTQLARLQTEVNLLSGGIFDPQPARYFFAGPPDGVSAEPAFRSIEQDDLPALTELSEQSGGLTGDELVALNLSGAWYRTTVWGILSLAPVQSVNGFGGDVLLDAVDVGATPGPEGLPALESGVDGDEVVVVRKGSGYYTVTLAQIAALSP